MKYFNLCLLTLCFGCLALGTGVDQLRFKAGGQSLQVGKEKRTAQNFRVDLSFLAPVWKVHWQGQGSHSVEISQNVSFYLEGLDPEWDHRCYAEGVYKKGKGVYLKKLSRCRRIWKN